MNWNVIPIVFSTCAYGLMLTQSHLRVTQTIADMESAPSFFGNVPPSQKCSGAWAKESVKGFTASELASPPQDACADPIDKCNNPVKYLGSNGDCACFACEYGKTTQHNICTKNEADKRTLLQRSRAD